MKLFNLCQKVGLDEISSISQLERCNGNIGLPNKYYSKLHNYNGMIPVRIMMI